MFKLTPLVVLLVAMLVSACGQKGPLFIPPQQQSPAAESPDAVITPAGDSVAEPDRPDAPVDGNPGAATTIDDDDDDQTGSVELPQDSPG